MSEFNPTNTNQKSRWGKVLAIIGIIGSIAGAIGIIQPVRDFFGWTKTLSNVELDASYPNESWKVAEEKDYKWIVDEWFYPSLTGFVSRFKIEDAKLYRQNEGEKPDKFKTEWVETKVYISNRKTLRISYPKEKGWDVNFYDRLNNYDCREYERYTKDDGTVISGEKRLMLSLIHCKISSDGITYDCK